MDNINNRTSWRIIWFTLTLVGMILFIRKPDALLNPQFWAEDGNIFFLQQYQHGATALFQSYAGYLHIVPRMIAFYTDLFFPYSLAPHVYNYSSFFITILVIAGIFSPRIQLDYKPLFTLSFVLVPHFSGEIFINITNLQWILLIALIFLLIKDTPNQKYGNIYLQTILDCATIILCGLTGPFLIFLLPLFILKALRKSFLYRSIILPIILLIVSIQIMTLIYSPFYARLPMALEFTISPYIDILGQKVFGVLFLGISVMYTLTHYGHDIFLMLLSIAYFIVIFSLFIYSFKTKKYIIIVFLAIHFIILFATFYKFQGAPSILIHYGAGPRYFYIPYLMIIWSLLLLLSQSSLKNKLPMWIGLACIAFSSATSLFQTKPFIDYNWYQHSQLIGKQDIIIPINPLGWVIRLKQSDSDQNN